MTDKCCVNCGSTKDVITFGIVGQGSFLVCMECIQLADHAYERDPNLVSVSAYFHGLPGDDKDCQCQEIFEAHGGEELFGAGTNLETRERDVEYYIPKENVNGVIEVLTAAGFRVEADWRH